MEVTLFETCINLIQSIMIALFLCSLITKPKGKHLALYTTGYAIMEFMYIQWMNTTHGLSGGLYELLDILFCFIYFSISSHQSIFKKATLAILPTFVITLVGVPMQFCLFSIFGNNWTEVMMNNRMLLVFFSNFTICLLFAVISKLYKLYNTYFNNNIDFLLFTSLSISTFLLTIFGELLHNTINRSTLFLLLVSTIVLIIEICFIFKQIIHNQINIERKKAQYIITRESSYLNSEIREKERFLNELKHNVNLFLSLLRSGADNSELHKNAQLLNSVNDIETISPLIQSTALATALYHAKQQAKENNITIKTTYFCTADFDVSEPDLYLLFSNLLNITVQHAIPDSEISVEVKEIKLLQKCKITVIIQCKENKESQLNLPESILHIIKSNHGDYLLSNHGNLWNSTIFLPLKREERREYEQD